MTKTRHAAFLKTFIACGCLASFIMLIAGCVSPDAANQIKTFSEATVLTASNTAQAFRLVEQSYYDHAVSKEVFASTETNFNPKAFYPGEIPPYMGEKGLEVRLEVIGGLESYAVKLSTLVGNSSLSNFDKYTTTLGSALSTIDTNLVKDSFLSVEPLTGNDVKIATTAINTLGHWIITYQQQKRAKEAIIQMQGPITNICQLLTNDFSYLQQQFTMDNRFVLENEVKFFKDNFYSFKANPNELRAEIQNLNSLERQNEANEVLFTSLSSAVNNLEKAHNSLQEVFSNNKTNTISSDLSQFATEAQRIGKYYSSLKSTN
jgi:hypothetical protein